MTYGTRIRWLSLERVYNNHLWTKANRSETKYGLNANEVEVHGKKGDL